MTENAARKWEVLGPRRVDGMGEECTVGSYVAIEFRSVHGDEILSVVVSEGAAEVLAAELEGLVGQWPLAEKRRLPVAQVTCKGCRFFCAFPDWQGEPFPMRGECRCEPPNMNGWPEVYGDQWCGEFMPREESNG